MFEQSRNTLRQSQSLSDKEQLDAQLALKDTISLRYIKGPSQGDSVLVSVQEMVPEDGAWRKANPRTPALICMQEDNACACPWKCVPKIAGRCQVLFDAHDALVQILIVFDRDEKHLRRRVEERPWKLKDMSAEELSVVKRDAPRFWALWVPRNFATRPGRPYELKRLNYDSLRILLKDATETQFQVPPHFWSMFS